MSVECICNCKYFLHLMLKIILYFLYFCWHGKRKISSRRKKILASLLDIWGTSWRSWLRHCATSLRVAGSIPDGVTEIFH